MLESLEVAETGREAVKTSAIIEGLKILHTYHDGHDDTTGADHDVIFSYPTGIAMPPEAVAKMVELGWSQDFKEMYNRKFEPGDYDPQEGWRCYV